MEASKIIKCPNCGTEINVNDILYHQLEKEIKQEYEEKSANQEKEFESRFKKEKEKLEKTIREKTLNETQEQVTSLQKEVGEKSNQLKELNKTKTENERLKREKEELRSQIEFEKEKEFNDKLREERQKIKKQSDEENTFKIKELEKKLEDQKTLVDEMKRKQEQGSMQLQGEVQELALEEMLKNIFPFDLIEEVGKGIKGADVIQTVRNKFGVDCGKILYESKRTKSFSNEWVSKLKSDTGLTKADLCIIVTEALPDGIDKIGQIDGVWVCSFNDFKSLVFVLRESLIQINEAYASQSNKGEKMQMLYDYLTSNEFRHQLGAIIEGFTDLQVSYVKEKRAMERIWKEREKQLEKVLLNTNHFIGSIKGIAGSSIPDLKQIGSPDNILELPE